MTGSSPVQTRLETHLKNEVIRLQSDRDKWRSFDLGLAGINGLHVVLKGVNRGDVNVDLAGIAQVKFRCYSYASISTLGDGYAGEGLQSPQC